MLKIGDVETQIDGVSRDTPLKSSKDVAKEAGVSKHSKMLTVGDNQYSNEGETRVPPKSAKEDKKCATWHTKIC